MIFHEHEMGHYSLARTGLEYGQDIRGQAINKELEGEVGEDDLEEAYLVIDELKTQEEKDIPEWDSLAILFICILCIRCIGRYNEN